MTTSDAHETILFRKIFSLKTFVTELNMDWKCSYLLLSENGQRRLYGNSCIDWSLILPDAATVSILINFGRGGLNLKPLLNK